MRTTIDRTGRILVPKALRDELRLEPGSTLEISATDNRLEIEPVPTEVRLEQDEETGVWHAVADREMPVLTTEMVRDFIDRTRR